MSFNIKNHAFIGFVCLVCGVLLVFAALALKPIQQRHIRSERQKAILKVIGALEEGHTYSKSEIKTLYSEMITEKWLTPTGTLTTRRTRKPLYIHEKDGVVQSYAIPVSGKGLWSRMYGFVALQGDGTTIQGFTIYSHKETPGIGSDVGKPWFLQQFKGKKIVDEEGAFVSITVNRKSPWTRSTEPSEATASSVDGISGATNTSKGVEKLLRRELSFYEFFSRRLRETLHPTEVEPMLEEESYSTENILPEGELPPSENARQRAAFLNPQNWIKAGQTPSTKNLTPTRSRELGQPKALLNTGRSPQPAPLAAPQVSSQIQDKPTTIPEKSKSTFRFFNRNKSATPTKSTVNTDVTNQNEEVIKPITTPKKAAEPSPVESPKAEAEEAPQPKEAPQEQRTETNETPPSTEGVNP